MSKPDTNDGLKQFLTLIKMANAIQIPMPSDITKDFFKSVMEDKTKDTERYQLNKELKIELVRNMVYDHLKEEKINNKAKQ